MFNGHKMIYIIDVIFKYLLCIMMRNSLIYHSLRPKWKVMVFFMLINVM